MHRIMKNIKLAVTAFLLLCIYPVNAWSWCWIRDTGRTSAYCTYGYQERCCSGNLRLWSDETMQYRISNSTENSLTIYIGTGASKWNNVTMSNFTFSEGTRTDAWDYKKDGINVINIDSSFCNHFPTYCGDGVLGFSGTWTSGSGTSYHAIESDVILNGEEYTWGDGTGGTQDTIAVIAHELGHSAGLTHPGNTCRSEGSSGCGREFSAATMYYALDVGFTTDKASLELDDAASLIYGYPVTALRIKVVDTGANPVSGASVELIGTSSPVNGSSISSGGKVYGDIDASLIGDKASSNTYVYSSPFNDTNASGYTNYIYPTHSSFSVSVTKQGSTTTQAITASSGVSTATVELDAYCTYSISPTSASFSYSGGTGNVGVTAPNGCGWTATSNNSWLTITSDSSGSGNGTVFYSVSENSNTSSRTGMMTIAGKTVTITQSGQQPFGVAYVNKEDSSCNGNTPCYTTIQSALDAANSGFVIKIRAGTYAENIDLNSSNNYTAQGSEDSPSFTTTLMPPSAVETENVIEKMTIIRLQREKDIEEDHSQRLSSQAANQQAGTCVVIDTITAPDDQTCGLAWDNGYLWVSEGGAATTYPGVIFKIDTAGNILSSFDAPGQSSQGPHPKGLAFDGTYLWSVDFLDNKIYKLSNSGAVIGSIPAPSGISSGLAWDGSNLWVSEWFSYKIYKLNPDSGQILMSFNAPDFEEEYPYGLAWDGAHLWVSNSNGIYMLDPVTGAVLGSCNDSAFKYGRAYGMTWDGQYLWGGSWVSNSIIKIDVPTLDTTKDLTLSGGWDSTFTIQSSITTVNSMTISNGSITVDNLVIQ